MAMKVAFPQAANGFTHSDDLNWTSEPKRDGAWEAVDSLKVYNDYSPKSGARRSVVKKAKKKAKDESLVDTLCSLICEHQTGLSINLLLLLFLTHICFPRARRRTHRFFNLSYYDAASGLYTSGIDDLSFVAFWIVVFTGLRAAVMDYILHPLASLGGIRTKKERVRFAEQAWLLIYYSVFWTLGMYIMSNSPYWFNPKEMWTHWPTRQMNGLFKWYYLVQFAFWLQQILVVNIEERRKDYAQMFTHHIITSALVFMSYGYYQMKVGNVILCAMDVVDIILPAAKMLKYLGYTTACDIAFGVFMAVWFVTRHIFYLMICWSLYADTPVGIPSACYNSKTGAVITATSSPNGYEMNGGTAIWRNILQTYLDPEGAVCWNSRIRWSFLGLLLALQVITLLWFAMIVRVAWKVVRGCGADDSRSDDEGEEEEEDVEDEELNESRMLHSNGVVKPMDSMPVEEEVGVESLTFTRRTSPGIRSFKRSSGRGGASRASGISIPGHGDRKELLGRIGCDKPT
ncbi:longevity assurance proteins LAG1/LAC1 [Lepidopterella palustris CBS 459.81]|uniref:Longevity assurance proteins LAG1/LAC1 n=1 Tax=Lepidopterella palustris CBS 459.81 TaxID=1314670 RepID=A0A8E2EJM8_9PEZI|nr:longevity assurance proteins LAG1/LAC1 [Lepidopterella palustris CBS 459.81]